MMASPNSPAHAADIFSSYLIVDIARYLNVPVVAEGVEKEDQLRQLKEIGCDMVQGYYFSRPVPADEFEKFIIKEVKAC